MSHQNHFIFVCTQILIYLLIGVKDGKQNTYILICWKWEEKDKRWGRILARGLRGMRKKGSFSLMFGRIKTRLYLLFWGIFLFRILFFSKLFPWAFASDYMGFFDRWACVRFTIVHRTRRTLGMNLENSRPLQISHFT